MKKHRNTSIVVSCVSCVSCVLPLHVSLQSVIRPACPACSPWHWSLCPGMALPLYPSSYQVAGSHLEQCDPMSAADVEPGTAAVSFQIMQQTSGYHVGWVQGLKDIKDPKTKETKDGLYLSQAISYQIHTRENKGTGAKERRTENQSSQGNLAVAINKIKNGCFWGFIPDEVCGPPARCLRWLCPYPWGLSECRACYARPESQSPLLSLGIGKRRARRARSPPVVPVSTAGEEVEEREREVKEAKGEAEGEGAHKEEEEGGKGKEDDGPNSKEEEGGSGGGRGRR